MFDSKTSLSSRLADTMDLLLDFATLGEYGLEPVGRTSRACEADRRTRAPRAAAYARSRESNPRGPVRREMRGRGVPVA
jgi:hypothetical protein